MARVCSDSFDAVKLFDDHDIGRLEWSIALLLLLREHNIDVSCRN